MQKKSIIRISIIVGSLLLVPLFGNLFIDGWNWSIGDFVVMGALLFATGLALDFAARKITRPADRIAACVAIVLAFVSVWVELAVDGMSHLFKFFTT